MTIFKKKPSKTAVAKTAIRIPIALGVSKVVGDVVTNNIVPEEDRSAADTARIYIGTAVIVGVITHSAMNRVEDGLNKMAVSWAEAKLDAAKKIAEKNAQKQEKNSKA